jgi:hypothetical protein
LGRPEENIGGKFPSDSASSDLSIKRGFLIYERNRETRV